MKKIVLSIFGAAIVAITAINVNLIVKSDLIVDESLANITALARNEIKCSICGYEYESCMCDFGITCPYPSCRGTWCHKDQYILLCPCYFHGDPLFGCIGIV